MKKNIRLWLIIVPAILLNLSARAQTISDAYAKIDPSGQGSNQKATFIIEVSDTNNISQIELKLGVADGEDNLISTVLNYDVTSGLPANYSYSRTGNRISIVTNDFPDSSTYFGSVRIKNNNETWSDPFAFITN